VLNADTKRSAVEAFVRTTALDPDRAWRVVPNRNGKINKVLPDPSGRPLSGWYAYLTRALETERTI
jgi:hypothetical protein